MVNRKLQILLFFSLIVSKGLMAQEIVIDSVNTSKYQISKAEIIRGKKDTEIIDDFQNGAINFGKGLLTRLRDRFNIGGLGESIKEKGESVTSVMGRKDEEENRKKMKTKKK